MRSPTRGSRRQVLQVLRMGAGAALSAGLWPRALRAGGGGGKDAGAFGFVCVNDLHCQDDECGRWLEARVLGRMKATKDPADFCLIVGDLAEKGTKQELGTVRDVFKGLGVPVYAVPGNHDYAAGD